MVYCCYNCEDDKHTCTAWDGTGENWAHDDRNRRVPNHNLAECPKDVTTCSYRRESMKSAPIEARRE